MEEISSLLSIVIPCYNDSQYIEQSVLSALNQTYANTEIIVVDDGSNTATKAVLQNLEPKIAKLITQDNQGQSTARNRGIREAKGKFILVLDSDDFFEPSFCEKAVLVLKDANIKIVACNMVRFNDEKKIDEYHHGGGDLSVLILNNQATGSVMFRKEDFVKIGGYDESMRSGLEDWEFYIRLLQHGGVLHIIKEPLFNYRIRSDSTTAKANLIKYDLLKYIYNKHHNLIVLNLDIVILGLIDTIKQKDTQIYKSKEQIEFRIGLEILKPFRLIKNFFK
jgi:glycosyltransferase involved in cell wall biosynthesis